MDSIPDLGTRDPVSADRPAGNASNGVAPGQTARILRGEGMIGGAQEGSHQPTVQMHPHGPFVNRDGNRFKVS